MSINDLSVADLLDEFGQALTLTRAGVPTYAPATGTVSNATGTSMDVRGVFINYHSDNVDGTLVRRGDRRLLITAVGATGVPAVGDIVEGHKVLDVRTFEPNGVVVAWDCQVRK